MNDEDRTDRPGPETEPAPPVSELRDLALDPDPELPGRVRRSIQRRIFAADSLDFSLTMMFATFWDYLRTLMEAVGEQRPQRKD